MRSRIRVSRLLSFATIISLAVALVAVAAAPANADSGPLSRTISLSGTATPGGAARPGTGNFARPEIAKVEGESAAGAAAKTNRSQSKKKKAPTIPVVTPTAVDGATPGKGVNFEGLRHRDQRLANGGNQFSLEPPDQGLCVGNGFVLETVNDVMRIWSTAGAPLTDPKDLNTFYGYPAQIDRSTGMQGPFVTDPSCLYDPDAQRWFHVVLTLDVVPDTGDFTGTNHLDLAVSRTDDPRGAWNLYRIPVQDDGTVGTPNHHCSQGPCIGDFPHIGADENGFYITTNEYSFFGPEFISAQLYAISKAKLRLGFTTVTVHQFDKLKVGGGPGFTVWPAIAPAGLNDLTRGGTEYFLSSMAGEEAGNKTGIDNRIGLWALTNTASLDAARPSLNLTNRVIDSQTYAVPKPSNQKAGDFPLGQCINDTTIPVTPTARGCWRFFFAAEPAHNEVESHLDSSDTRMMQVIYAGGLLYGALDTAVMVNGQEKAGIAWFVIRPTAGRKDEIDGAMVAQGYLAVAGNNVTYPAIAVRPDGKGVIAFTLLGADYYPTAGYVTFSVAGTSTVHVATLGTAPHDGFTAYKAFVGDPPRTRWGDYGAAAVDGNSIWLASEYIAQPPCTLSAFVASSFNCGETRSALGNWSTRVTQVTPP